MFVGCSLDVYWMNVGSSLDLRCGLDFLWSFASLSHSFRFRLGCSLDFQFTLVFSLNSGLLLNLFWIAAARGRVLEDRNDRDRIQLFAHLEQPL